MLHKCRLHRVQMARLSQSFNRCNLIDRRGMHDRQRQAAIDSAAIHMHRTGSALAMVAAFLSPRKIQVLAQAIEQRRTWIECQSVIRTIDSQCNRYSALGFRD